MRKIIFEIAGGFLLFAALCGALMTGVQVNSANIQENTKKLPIYSVETEEKVVAFSFNCAWDVQDLDSILDTLEKNQIKTTFFMTGEWVENYPDCVKKIAAAGHDLANHGDTHGHMNSMSKEECVAEIMNMHKKVFELLGTEMQFFRPPYGEYNDTVIATAQECGYYPIQWDVDTLVI